MRRSQLFIKTRKQAPADEESKNAQLLIRAGFIHKEMAGVYSYLLPGKLVLDNISQIIREEMNAIGGNEVLMSTLQNKELWEATGRWDDKAVDNWFKSKLANGTEVGIGLSHEEPIVNMLKSYVTSYKDLPVYPYQIQNKFRNELRAKSGLLRGREFLMKDLYSFSRSQEEHDGFYEKVAAAYLKIFERVGFDPKITFRTFASGGIFSRFSDEFQVLSHVGEDTIYVHEERRFAINKEIYNEETLQHLQETYGNVKIQDIGVNMDELKEKKAVEVGNIFSLGSKYSDALGLKFTDEDGQTKPIIMGCYGIGVSRLMGLLAEHFTDAKGLVWPELVAPYKVYLARLGEAEAAVRQADELYERLRAVGIEVLYDDRDERAGAKFADADLLGLPWRLVVSEQTAEKSQFELKSRTSQEIQMLTGDAVMQSLTKTGQA